MEDDLLRTVRLELKARKGCWPSIAKALPGISYSWLSQVGRGAYKSAPSYKRLRMVVAYFEEHPRQKRNGSGSTRASRASRQGVSA